ncbi:hypothetical protein M513_11533 [Trichuris suis]|uniref:Secreted protein n=1 Tax=Trichuris suis TaxID=68888 RepID=A0A085LRL8_9BILA|nr:hypothetical protein M513_11533 [Trichuris suis]
MPAMVRCLFHRLLFALAKEGGNPSELGLKAAKRSHLVQQKGKGECNNQRANDSSSSTSVAAVRVACLHATAEVMIVKYEVSAVAHSNNFGVGGQRAAVHCARTNYNRVVAVDG